MIHFVLEFADSVLELINFGLIVNFYCLTSLFKEIDDLAIIEHQVNLHDREVLLVVVVRVVVHDLQLVSEPIDHLLTT